MFCFCSGDIPFLVRQDITLKPLQNAIDHIAAGCYHAGVREAVICPGSRNAPLVLAFVRSQLFSCVSVIDERSAGFIAMGMALRTSAPVAVICTSGSAVVNLYPAVVEAFYQRIPLLLITADRPPELIDQWDGQTIRQAGVFGTHVKKYAGTPDHYADVASFFSISLETAAFSLAGIRGPVHINVPLREPLYPFPERPFSQVQLSGKKETREEAPERRKEIPALKGKILFICGMSAGSEHIEGSGLVVLRDMMCNYTGRDIADEKVLMIRDEALLEALRPDVLVSSGSAMLSKPLKNYLRKYKPARHYHFDEKGDCADPFGTSPVLVRCRLEDWLEEFPPQTDPDYYSLWQKASQRVGEAHQLLMKSGSWQEFSAVQEIMSRLPEHAVLHLGNSMSVRYAAFCGRPEGIREVYCNRGTSGIDGSVSTALGFSAGDSRWNTLLIGDVAFLYDSNALWNDLPKNKFRVIILNNAGGGIFRLIDGPSGQPELEKFFETVHRRNAEALCENLNIKYYKAFNKSDLHSVLEHFWEEDGTAAVLEIFTERSINQQFFEHYKSKINGINVSMENN
jgi:2-succinyl-5-enolpyruvyl-6-hydroxy-3-cyclohexene-1-carboxylate synthase